MTAQDGPNSLASLGSRLARRSDALACVLLGLLAALAAAATRAGGASQLWGRELRRAPVPAPLPPQLQPKRRSGNSSLSAWRKDPGSTFKTPRSRCSIDGAGRVRRLPPPPPDSSQLPFLFNLSAEALPSQKQACSHCPKTSCDPLPEAWPAACCGVCAFERRFCRTVYPGQGKSERIAREFMAQGHPLHDLTPCELFQRIRGRTLWLLGDSQTWHFYYAVECFLREFAPSLRRSDPLPNPELNARLTTATMALCYERYPVPPICLDLAHGTRVCAVRADSASVMADVVLPTLAEHVEGFAEDLMVVNTGLHYYEDVMCKGGACQVPGTNSTYVRDLRKLADFRAVNRARLPRTLWMDTPPQHFPGTGDWSGKYKVKECTPHPGWQRGDPVALAGGTWNAAAAPLVAELADAHLATWNASVALHDSHMPQECTHWCQPGAYHLWLYLMNEVLRDQRLGNNVSLRQPA